MKIFFVSEPTQISTPFFVRGGGPFSPSSSRGKDEHERKGRDDDDDDDDDARARTIPFSSGLSIDSSIGEDTRERDALRGGQRAKKDKRIDPAHLFCVQQNDFDKKKRRERGRKRGFFFFFFFSKTRARPLPSLSLVESSSKDRSSRSVAVYRRRRRVAFFECFKVSICFFSDHFDKGCYNVS